MKTVLAKLMSRKPAEVREIVAGLDATSAPRGLRRRFEKIRNKAQGGFTLLELLVVVAIMAVIGAAATAMLEEVDRKAAAGAHVEIMNDMMRNIGQYAKLNNEQYPDRWDSLLASTGGVLTTAAAAIPVASGTNYGLDSGLTAMLAEEPLTDNIANTLTAAGINNVQVIDLTAANDPNTAGNPGDCGTLAGIRTMIAHKGSDVTNGAIFSTFGVGDRRGCGAVAAITAPGGAAVDDLARLAATENYRVGAGANDILIALGIGSSNTLFNQSSFASSDATAYTMTGAPFYRHVDGLTYNRFVALFNVGTTAVPFAAARLQAVIDGSGDTKEEELGEWDNTRSTL